MYYETFLRVVRPSELTKSEALREFIAFNNNHNQTNITSQKGWRYEYTHIVGILQFNRLIIRILHINIICREKKEIERERERE